MSKKIDNSGFDAGRWFGFPVRIDYSWFFVFLLVLWTFTEREFPAQLPGYGQFAYTVMGATASILFFVSVLLHEFAHAGMARARGISVTRITLFIFGGLAELRSEARRPADEFLITVVGPLASFALGLVFLGAFRVSEGLGLPAPVATVARFLAIMNVVLAVFNMVPAFPLDGGRLLRSLLWKLTGDADRATRWSAMLGRGFGLLLIAYGALLALRGQLFSGGWAAMIGWFLFSAARGSSRQQGLRRLLSSVTLREVLEASAGMGGSAETVVSTEVEVHQAGNDRGEGVAGLDQFSVPIPTLDMDDSLEAALLAMRHSGSDRVRAIQSDGSLVTITLRDMDAWLNERSSHAGRRHPETARDTAREVG